MSRTPLVAWQAVAAIAAVLALASIGGGRYPLYVDLSVYAAAGLMAATGTAQFIDWREKRQHHRPAGEAMANRPDQWEGKPLSLAQPLTDVDLHYRIYDAATGDVLGFGTNGGPGSLNGIVTHALKIQRERPEVRLYVEQFDQHA